MHTNESTTAQKAQLLPLTGVRFFLALWVVLFHQAFYPGVSWISLLYKPLTGLIQAGYMAVGVFFVLSGFVLSYNYRLDESWLPSQVKRFGIARFARIYPAYCIGLVLSSPWMIGVLLKQHSQAAMAKESVKAVLAAGLVQAWVPVAAEVWNGPGWSLSVEAFFYFCFPVLGVLLWKLSRPMWILGIALTIWMASLAAPVTAISVPLTGDGGVPASAWTADTSGWWVSAVKFNPLAHLPEFCIGVVVGRAYHLLRAAHTKLLGRGYWLYFPAMLLEVAAILRYQSTCYLFLHNGLLLPLHSLVILGFALDGGVLARMLSIRPLGLLGNASYSMYIFQMPVAGAIFFVLKRYFSAQAGGLATTVLYVVVLVCFSSAVFKIIEEPANRILKKRLTTRPPIAAVTAIACESAASIAASGKL
jgi:peptidoglycan/LPS O-acetylase OafA/YrhL